MKRSLLEIYALGVCFVTLICFAIALGVGLYDVVEIVNPEFTLSDWEFEKHQTNEKFLASWSKEKPIPPEDQVTALRKQSYAVAVEAERRSALQSLVMVAIIILIDIVIFLLHWRLGGRARQASGVA
jgi:hypothetical protein